MRWLRLLKRGRNVGADECARVGAVIQSYLDGEYQGDASWITHHLDVCAHCGLEADVLHRIKDAVARQGQPDSRTRARLQEFADRLADGGLDAADAT